MITEKDRQIAQQIVIKLGGQKALKAIGIDKVIVIPDGVRIPAQGKIFEIILTPEFVYNAFEVDLGSNGEDDYRRPVFKSMSGEEIKDAMFETLKTGVFKKGGEITDENLNKAYEYLKSKKYLFPNSTLEIDKVPNGDTVITFKCKLLFAKSGAEYDYLVAKVKNLSDEIKRMFPGSLNVVPQYEDEWVGFDIDNDKSYEKGGKVEQVMSEFKRHKLKDRWGNMVTDRKQAIAIALSSARAAGEYKSGGELKERELTVTDSNKPIYGHFEHPGHKEFDEKDHYDSGHIHCLIAFMADSPDDANYHMGEAQKHMGEAMKKKFGGGGFLKTVSAVAKKATKTAKKTYKKVKKISKPVVKKTAKKVNEIMKKYR